MRKLVKKKELEKTIPSQGWKFMSCSHSQELCQQTSWLLIGWHKSEQSIKSQVSKLTQLLTWLQLINFRPRFTTAWLAFAQSNDSFQILAFFPPFFGIHGAGFSGLFIWCFVLQICQSPDPPHCVGTYRYWGGNPQQFLSFFFLSCFQIFLSYKTQICTVCLDLLYRFALLTRKS